MSKNEQVKKSIDKEKVKKLYFEEHLTQVAIAKLFNVSKQRINTILKPFSKSDEKEYKHQKSLQHKKDYNTKYLKNYKRTKSTDTEEYYALQYKLDKDSQKLSIKSEMSDWAFTKFNSSIYKYDSKGNKVILENIKSQVTNDVPKFVPTIQIALLPQGHHI